MARILVAGGAGFLGSHLCRGLLAEGHSVLCADDFSTGAPGNVSPLLGEPGFELLRLDVTCTLDVAVDRIYNLACPASPVHYQRDPIRTTRTCVLGTLNLLELARRTGARVLQASTSEVYGDPEVHPQTEDYLGRVDATGTRGCYDEGKRCAETLCFDFRRVHGVDVRVARIFNTYGPRMRADDGRVVAEFIARALRGEAIVIHGNGHQTRSLCFVSDMVRGLIGLMQATPPPAGPVNLGSPVETRILDLAEQVRHLSGSACALVHAPRRQDDPTRRCPDISRARRVLGWSPQVGLEDGLLATIAAARCHPEG